MGLFGEEAEVSWKVIVDLLPSWYLLMFLRENAIIRDSPQILPALSCTACWFCPPDDDDDRRRLLQLESQDYTAKDIFEAEVQPIAAEAIESFVQSKASEYTCLGSSPTIVAVIEPTYFWDLTIC